MKPNAWQKQDLKANNPPPNSLLDKIRTDIVSQSDSPYLDALVLLAHICEKSKSEILSNPNPDLTPEKQTCLNQALSLIKEGVPLPYVLGKWEFFGLQFLVTPEVLIPRPESEWLVETGINWLKENPKSRTGLEMGTGSGCLAVSLAKEIHDLRIIATDMSYPALLIAQENAVRHGVLDQLRFITADLFKGIQIGVDLIIANLPYVPTTKLNKLSVSKTEPILALDGGPDGLSYIQIFLERAPEAVNPGGLILLELDEERGEKALVLANNSFPKANVQLKEDLAGQNRYLQIQIP